jgi:predicted nucleic acid-binding protein
MPALILDTSGLLALADSNSRKHKQAEQVAEQYSDWLISAAILAEVDYMLSSRLGNQSTLTLMQSISDGEIIVESYLPQDVRYCIEKTKKYNTLNLGLADCAVMALSERLHIPTIFSLDNHFNIVKPSAFKQFVLPLAE